MLVNKRFKTLLVKNNKYTGLDSFTVDCSNGNIRYLNEGELWFCVGDVLSAVGYCRCDSYRFCNEVIKQEDLIRARFTRNGSNFWFCNIGGVSAITMAQKRRNHIISERSKRVLSFCKKMLRDDTLKKHEVEEIIDEEIEVVDLIPINKGDSEIGTVNQGGEIYFALVGLLRLLGHNYANSYSVIKGCGISDSSYIKLLCRFKGKTSKRFLVDQVAAGKIIDKYKTGDVEKDESIREWLCGKTSVIEDRANNKKLKEVSKEMENKKMKYEELSREMVDELNTILKAKSAMFRFRFVEEGFMDVVPCNNKWINDCKIDLSRNFVMKLAIWFKDVYGISLETCGETRFYGKEFCSEFDSLQKS